MKEHPTAIAFAVAFLVAIVLGVMSNWQVGGLALAAICVAGVALKMREVTEHAHPPAL